MSNTVSKPRLSLGQIFFMSFGFLGIQFGFALQNGNASRILRSFGADVDQLPAFWIVAPLMGMLVQPIIGHYSDRTWNRIGRRKPYFLVGDGDTLYGLDEEVEVEAEEKKALAGIPMTAILAMYLVGLVGESFNELE
jgi:MFS family permease